MFLFQEEIRARHPKYNFKAVTPNPDISTQESPGDTSLPPSSSAMNPMPPQAMIPAPAMIPPGEVTVYGLPPGVKAIEWKVIILFASGDTGHAVLEAP